MAGSKEIRTKIKSVENTRKITKAMEMVAASKMRKAQDRMRASRPYADKIRNVAAHMSFANPEYKHPFLIKRDVVKNVGLIVLSSDKGLCGGLNTNVLRMSINQMKTWESDGEKIAVTAIGNKGFSFMNRMNADVRSHVIGLGDVPHMETLIGAIKVMLDAYTTGEIDQVIRYGEFAMSKGVSSYALMGALANAYYIKKDQKKALENKFTEWANANPERKKKYGEALSCISTGYEASNKSILSSTYLFEAGLLGSDIIRFAYRFNANAQKAK